MDVTAIRHGKLFVSLNISACNVGFGVLSSFSRVDAGTRGGIMQKLGWLLLSAAGAAGLAAAVPSGGSPLGNETVNYTYDALGRLTGSNTTGGPNNTRTTGTCFDAAGNRVRYDVSTTAPSPCPTPTP